MSTRPDTRSRQQRRGAAAEERRALRTGDWGHWTRTPLPNGLPDVDPFGWCAQIRSVAKCDLYVALIRPVKTPWGEVHHLAIRTHSSLEPPWRDKQRIKNELFGPEYTAVEVMPPQPELIDHADMYHVWVLPRGFTLPFTIYEGARAA